MKEHPIDLAISIAEQSTPNLHSKQPITFYGILFSANATTDNRSFGKTDILQVTQFKHYPAPLSPPSTTLYETKPAPNMDLLGAESRKTGTRGGRADFTWDSVKPEERQYYLGNSVAGPSRGRHARSSPDFDWYTKPNSASASASASAPTETPTTQLATTADLQLVRRREKEIMEQMIVGRSFSDAVRSALAESIGSGVDDEGGRGDAAAAAARRAVLRRGEKVEKAQRKEMRRRIRELRCMRRAERYRRRDRQQEAIADHHDSTESERESLRSRMNDEAGRRRRRRGRDNGTRRKRSAWTSSSDSDDSDGHRSRRQRLR